MIGKKFVLGDVVAMKADLSRTGVVITVLSKPTAMEGKQTVYRIRFGDLTIAELYECEVTKKGKATFLHEHWGL